MLTSVISGQKQCLLTPVSQQPYIGVMNYISITYTIKYELDFAPNYKWTELDECFNSKTGRRIKQVYNNGCIGYNIKGKFYSLKKLRKHLRKPIKIDCPF